MSTGLLGQVFPPADQILARLVRSPLGAFAEQPWLDPVGLAALRRWYFPLSRLAAVAAEAGGDVARFVERAGLADGGAAVALAARAGLAHAVRTRAAAATAAARWDEAAFGETPRDDLAALDGARVSAGLGDLAARAAFLPLLALASVPPVRWAIPDAAAVAAAHGARLARPDSAFALADVPPVALSQAWDVPAGRRRWLRFASPSVRIGDTAYARVTEPRDGGAVASVVAVNGIGIDIDVLDGGLDVAAMLAARGLRVIELMTAWHGRRAPAGWYGGEPFFGTAPLGALDLLEATVREIGVLVGWARRFARPVGVVGTSFGALACQLVLSCSGGWPAALRPDAALLIGHSGRLEAVTFDGALTGALGLGAALAAAGWDRDALRPWLPLLDPAPSSAVDPACIVSLVGRADRIVPADDGTALCARWGVPAANRFVTAQCHFSTRVHLFRNPAPIERLCAVLNSIDSAGATRH